VQSAEAVIVNAFIASETLVDGPGVAGAS
jgi:hypothetical protein